MVETDWREILSFSQRELDQADKEKLCESLSWMEADDIELNFSDLKSLFRIAQDILKYKSEQVNNLFGQLETASRKGGKKKGKSSHIESPGSTDSAIATLAQQEEEIKTNKEILEQLYADIADLEERKSKLTSENADSESSRDALSEMDAVVQLENDVAMKNKHIRKLLSDIKKLEEENTNLKEKISVLKDKLTEATQLIDNLTEQLLSINNECIQLKDILGKTELTKAQQTNELENLRKELIEKDSKREIYYEEIKTKVQHWKNVAKSKKSELEALSIENLKLKEELDQVTKSSSCPKPIPRKGEVSELKIKELQDKLTEASNEIEQSAKLINLLRSENRQLKGIIEETPTQDYSLSDVRNESDDGKERILINKLKKKVKSLSINLQKAEELVVQREKELAEISTELQLLKSDNGIKTLVEGLKRKKQEIKAKDENLRSLFQEVNYLSQQVNDLQLENETLRQKFDVPSEEMIVTDSLVKKYRDIEKTNSLMCKEIRNLEDKLVNAEVVGRSHKSNVDKLTKVLRSLGFNERKIEDVLQNSDSENSPRQNDKESARSSKADILEKKIIEKVEESIQPANSDDTEMKALTEENEGLRKGLQEILDFLKDNSKTTSGILALQCPSLEALLQSMEARHAAGWFAPHMATVMELRSAIGGKDALLTALHEARKETFQVMSQLSKESQKSSELEQKLKEIENQQIKTQSEDESINMLNQVEFGTWIADNEQNGTNFNDRLEVEELISKGNSMYEGQLKKGLEYFCTKFKSLYDKISSMAIQAADDKNKWSLQEEQYKAQIENLKSQIQQQEDEDISDNSPGLISVPNSIFLQRKCNYLEESYKYIRTLNENIKNENMETKKEMMTMACEYENEIQKLVLSVVNLSDKLRNSISLDLFWKQNVALNDIGLKYRKLLDISTKYSKEPEDVYTRLENYRYDIISSIRNKHNGLEINTNNSEQIFSNVEESILKKQIQELCSEISNRDKKIEYLEKTNNDLQESQSKLIDKSIATLTTEDINLMKSQLLRLTEDSKILKEKYQDVSNQLDVALLQQQENQHRQLSNDIEVNILRHQILDLQSASDNKAIVSRLSGEVLVAHLQASDSHKKIENLSLALNKERELRIEAEEMLTARQKIFDVYTFRYESKFRYMYEVLHVLRQQYQGSVPLISIENYLNRLEDFSREKLVLNEKLQEIEDLRSNLMAKHSVFDQILDVSKNKCITDEGSCPHKLKYIMQESIHNRELEHINNKLKILEQTREDLIKQCNSIEKTLVLVNQGFEKSNVNGIIKRDKSEGEMSVPNLELEDVQSDDDSSSRRSKTITLPKPQVLKPLTNNNANNYTDIVNLHPNVNGGNLNNKETSTTNLNKTSPKKPVNQIIFSNISTQTILFPSPTEHTAVQTAEDKEINQLKQNINTLINNNEKQSKELKEALTLVQERNKENLILNTDKITLEAEIQHLKATLNHKDKLNEKLRIDINELTIELETTKKRQIADLERKKESFDDETKSLVTALKQLENEKKVIIAEYNDLLENERKEYAKNVKELNKKYLDLKTKFDKNGSEANGSGGETVKEITTKYAMKIVHLEDKCFKLQNDLDDCKNELVTYQNEAERWKELASERLVKMEQLSSQLEQRHNCEVESYKAENHHWLLQLNENQREHMELRSRLSEQKALHLKQLAEKDSQMEHMRSVINSLKTQIMNMQTMISVNDPSFDLSAIVEVEEASDVSHQGSDRLEIKFDSSGELIDAIEDFGRIPCSSTAIWQEPVIERLRRDKQLISKQNAMLRRQIKALAARERRARLDAQNLKNQVFRISTSGSKAATAETVSLQNKIASLQAQLTSARRDTHSSIALWDKWKRAQQAADKWQARYEEKCQEVKKLEVSLNMNKSALTRLEREKRVLMSKLSDVKSSQISIEKQDNEAPEKSHRSISECINCLNASSISNTSLLERVQAQQRRIAALEVAEKGNEVLVSEYEKSLAEITSLKGQVLKLESTLLESQIRTPIKSNNETQPELEYWKSYCEMLKEENVQLNLRVNSMETIPTTAHQHRINDLKQTVLTLRGLVSKLQSEQKSTSSGYKKSDSRPSSGRSSSEKGRGQLESYRVEIANLKRSIQDKDLLLERSKEMLKIAAEREDDLLRENTFLRRQLDELTSAREGFLSA